MAQEANKKNEHLAHAIVVIVTTFTIIISVSITFLKLPPSLFELSSPSGKEVRKEHTKYDQHLTA